jgi:hypothetical protein
MLSFLKYIYIMGQGKRQIEPLIMGGRIVEEILLNFRVKFIFGSCGLKTLFFGTSVSIRITDGTCVLGKDGLGTSVYFFVQYLTVCHVSTLRG